MTLEGECGFYVVGNNYFAGMETFVPWDSGKAEPPFAALFRSTDSSAPKLTATPATLSTVIGNPGSTLAATELLQLLEREDKPELTLWDLSNKFIPGVSLAESVSG